MSARWLITLTDLAVASASAYALWTARRYRLWAARSAGALIEAGFAILALFFLADLAEALARPSASGGFPVPVLVRLHPARSWSVLLAGILLPLIGFTRLVRRYPGKWFSGRRSASTESKEARLARRLREVQRIAHLGLWEWNVAEDRLWWSDEVYGIFGLSPRAFGGTKEAFFSSVHPEDRARVRAAVDRALRRQARYEVEHRVVRPDSSVRWVHERAEVFRDEAGAAVRVVGTVQDITEVRGMELQLRRLAARLERIREEERLAVARDLHDDLGQVLSAMSMDLMRWRGEGIPGDATDRINDLLQLVEQASAAARRLIERLRPGPLHELGFAAALEWLAERFTERTELPVRLDLQENGEDEPTGEVATALYRVAQEALTNVARHAGARTAVLTFAATPTEWRLSIADDGVGLAGDPEGEEGYGILGMRERVAALGGTLDLGPAAGGGTLLDVTVPR